MKLHLSLALATLLTCASSEHIESESPEPRSTKEEVGSPLYVRIANLDAQLFEDGFNTCDMESLNAVTAEDFEFYHDQAGTNGSKDGFVQSIDTHVCQSEYRAIRRILPDTMTVFPLYQNDELYGAVQTASHEFYARYPDGREELTDTARLFTLWIKTPKGWKMRRSFSYDHVQHN